MYPTLEKVKEIAASGEYRRIPVCKELYADRYTPVEVSPEYPQNRGGYGCDKESGTSGRYSAGDY